MENKEMVREKLNELNRNWENLNKKIRESIENISRDSLHKEVEHKNWGKGKMIKEENSIIYIEFMGNLVKKFKIPDAFVNKFLMVDDDYLEKMNNIRKLMKEEEQIRRKIDETQMVLDELENGKKVEYDKITCESAKQCIKQGYISVADDVEFRTIRDVSDLFNKNYKGTQKSWIPVDSNWQKVASCYKMTSPADKSMYRNILTADGNCFYYLINEETNDKKEKKIKDIIEHEMKITFLFLKYPNTNGYKFVGVFEKDVEEMKKSIKEKEYKVVYKRIADKLDLKQFFK